MKAHARKLLFALAVALAGPGTVTALAQDDGALEDPTPLDGELRQALEHYFRNQLRLELALSDEQMARVGPEVERVESARAEARRQRMAAMRALQRGLREGATDERLEASLAELERVETVQREAEREAMAEIDAALTVRQRVQFRFFIQRFRQDLSRQVDRLRYERRGPPGPAPGGAQGSR